MDDRIMDLCRIPNIDQYEDIHLLTLAENCTVLEEQVICIAQSLSTEQRMVIDEYISTRNDLEVETFKTALRWGKHHYK